MDQQENTKTIKVAILQRVATEYRMPLFKELSESPGINLRVFVGDDLAGTKVKGTPRISEIDHRKLKTRFLKLGRRIMPWHVGLIRELRKFDPDVILCEGESHFVGYVQAIIYKNIFSRRTSLLHWCYISLPGWDSVGGSGPTARIKSFFRKFFDGFVVYSSFSKNCLTTLGQPSSKIFVATNVGDTQRFIDSADATSNVKSEARAALKLPDQFTVIYVGQLDENKRPQVFLNLAARTKNKRINFVVVGSGDLETNLNDQVIARNLDNVTLPGRVNEQLPLYYRAADVMLIPGRGGIVISEAMAFGLPVVVHQADGTESDLVQHNVTGIQLESGDVDEIHETLNSMANDVQATHEMGANARKLLETKFTTHHMSQAILTALKSTQATR